MKYRQMTVKVPHEEADLASCALIEAGSEGVSVKDAADVKEVLTGERNWDYYDASLDKIPDTGVALVTGCFAEDADVSGVYDALRSYLGRDVEVLDSLCDSADWENEWRKYYRPIDFGRLVVVPEWLDGDYGKTKILIDPGMAFGTGSHETTGMCVELLADLDLKGKKVLDVGCGSGILGIAALALGARILHFDRHRSAGGRGRELQPSHKRHEGNCGVRRPCGQVRRQCGRGARQSDGGHIVAT